ncbi:RICIN domain-containing protein [Streptomyces sp. NPDC000594]|uniref:RICIN domain-containing protein n=1 Tax=Streptomyces sp. NPDC000594 TaxID=3154261 RepID=UPI003319F354
MTVRVITGTGRGVCPEGSWALYEDAEYNRDGPARILVSDEDIEDLHRHGFGDRASSAVNRTDFALVLYTDAEYTGDLLTVVSGGTAPRMAAPRADRGSRLPGRFGAAGGTVYSGRLTYPAGPARLRAGVYTLTSAQDGRRLDGPDPRAPEGAPARQGPAGERNSQRWLLLPEGSDGHYRLENLAAVHRLDPGGARDDGAPVRLHADTGARTQLWRLCLERSGAYTLTNAVTGKRLDADPYGDGVNQWTPHGGTGQRWFVRLLPGAPATAAAPLLRRVTPAPGLLDGVVVRAAPREDAEGIGVLGPGATAFCAGGGRDGSQHPGSTVAAGDRTCSGWTAVVHRTRRGYVPNACVDFLP